MTGTLHFGPLHLLHFRAGGHDMAIDARYMVQVTTTESIHAHRIGDRIHNTALYNGQPIPFMKFGESLHNKTYHLPMLILLIKQRYVAFVVEEVKGDVTLSQEAVEVAQEKEYDPKNLIHGIYQTESGAVLILDIEQVFAPILNTKALRSGE
jgi:chemotaxis signal transduction protein